MTSLLTVTFSNTSSILLGNFLPEIMLDEEDCDYSCALLDLIIKTKDADTVKTVAELDVLRVDCDVITGSYINGKRQHTIHQFATCTSHTKGRVLAEIPKNLIYFPIKFKSLHSIQISIADQNGKLLDIKDGGEIICRINIKREQQRKTV